MIYLDNAATTPVRREALEAMWPHLTGGFGNPSSHHQVGEAAATALREARTSVARSLGCRPGEVTFTSGGTESDNLAIKGIALGAPRGRHLVTSPIEHEAVLESCDYLRRLHGFEVTVLPVDAAGRVDPAGLARALRPDTTLVSVHYANNEVGTVQPLAELALTTHAAGVPFHTDAVQAGGWLDLNVTRLGVDALSLSGHKLGAPPGIGAVFLRGRLVIEPLLHGGGQERGKRSGTENVAGAVALAVALRLAVEERAASVSRTSTLRDEFIETVLRETPSAQLTGHPTERLPGTASFVFPGTSGEAVLLELEQRGIVCSSGSACAAGSSEPSHVLTAMGLSADVAQTAVRFTLGAGTTAAETAEAAASVRVAVAAVASLGT
ncbi:cysteine desulfurase [Cryobacterium sp. TMT1-3]|uniref:cysteine desulfurase n=1 Tax=Cryobacterium luteum TaxID=1424661 RepID=A0A1H8E3R7_9MICO|nr:MULTISPECIES: cysteine desulfurase family protein [Cryobacterium]TFB89801.1 cysteine desulfurase [Cryobacterium luteum]TFC25515.1 cysteine desulfurase [Cryobacterium sp. TMT1-3]SEN14075.1 cysteine desulfurase [Cryobacterium luteum]